MKNETDVDAKQPLNLRRPFIGLYPSCSGIIVTKNDKFDVNLMPVGLVGSPSLSPPMISISVYKKHYTYSLLKKYKEFTFNLINKALIKQTIYLGAVSGRKTDKLKESGLHVVKAEKINTPYIKECPINLECRVIKEIDFEKYGFFIGEIVYSHITKRFVDKTKKYGLDLKRMGPVAALFLDFYEVRNYLGSYKAN